MQLPRGARRFLAGTGLALIAAAVIWTLQPVTVRTESCGTWIDAKATRQKFEALQHKELRLARDADSLGIPRIARSMRSDQQAVAAIYRDCRRYLG